MPATLIDDPLGITFVSTARRTDENIRLGKVSNPVLASEMLIGLVDLVHPHGRIDEIKTFKQYVTSIRRFVAELTDRGHVGGAANLTRPQLAQYWMAASNAREYKTRRILAAMDDELGVLKPDVRALVDGRHFNPQRRRDKRRTVPYSEQEWQQLQQVCRESIRRSYGAHRAAIAAAERGRDPREGGFDFDNVCWLFQRRGPMTWTAFSQEFGSAAGDACTEIVPKACTALFVDTSITLAYRTLFGTYSGIVPDGIESLGVEDLDWAGDSTILLRYLKGRTSTESLTLNARSVRLLEQWLDHSTLTRNTAPAEARGELWARYANGRYGQLMSAEITSGQVTEWIQRDLPAMLDVDVALVADDGEPLRVNRLRIRTTFESLRDRKSWFGSSRATVDPNHTPAIEGDNYLTATTPAQQDAVDTIIENAQADVLRKARPPIVLTTQETAEFAQRFPDAVRAMRLSDETITALVTTVGQDVFVAACADPMSGLHGPAGKPCPARPWVCLLCPLAIFTPRHAVNLLRMQAFFARQWQQLPSAQFMATFGPYAQRIDDILGAFRDRDPALLTRAVRDVADADTELPLLPEERTNP
ncbi:hypothetical protein [Amycolatopsis sp. lyj-108]|uniref:hypothetical protein n=1 Tax=Amycolatopsis sp. lyj-108 TaxID=2789286 RepID=UPI00397C28CA